MKTFEEEIRDAAEDVCYPDWEREDSISELREGLRQLFEENSPESINESLFSNFDCFNQSQINQEKKNLSYIQSPIVNRNVGRVQPCVLANNRTIDYDNDSDDDASDEVLSKFPREENLVNEAYDLISRVYEDCNDIDKKISAASLYFGKTMKLSNDKENTLECQRSASAYVQTEPDTNRTTLKALSQNINPCLRRVLCPEPGRPFLRHDPVKKMQIYKEEWKRMPTPEEQKRLELRWKVREHMLRREFPKKFPSGVIAHHPKDWSPKAYLD